MVSVSVNQWVSLCVYWSMCLSVNQSHSLCSAMGVGGLFHGEEAGEGLAEVADGLSLGLIVAEA